MWIVYDLAILLYQLILFTSVGFGFSCFAFHRSRHWPMRLVWAPFLGMIVLTVVSADLMYSWLPGQYASWLSLGVCGASSLALSIIFSRRSSSKRKLYWQPMLPAVVAAMLFISPLLLSNSRGFFALNGGDFGSYGGWGDYFADKTCLNGPEDKPINFTGSSFINLQNHLKKSSTGWRMGNITYFVFIKDTSPADFYTSYECCIAFNYYVLMLLVFAFCRDILHLRLRYALSMSWAYILCNTITWLGMSHFLGNLIGLVILLGIQSLLVNSCHKPSIRQGIMLCVAFGAALLQYPELLPYCAAVITPVLITVGWKRDQLLSTCKVGLICVAGGFLLVAPYDQLAVNWVLPMFHVNARVDNVGIYRWAYMSQLFGLVDYDYVLRNEAFKNAFQLTMLCTVAASLLTPFSLRKDRSLRPALGLLAGIGIVLLGCVKFAVTHNLFFLFRSYVSLSTFVFLFPALSAVRALWAVAQRNRKPPKAHIYALAALAIVFFGCLATVRMSMIKRVQKGTPHARIFGTRYLKIVDMVKAIIAEKHADCLIVDYHGSGTIQAGWEWLLQKLPYVFPTAGVGCTPFRTDFLKDERVLILDEGYPHILQIEGRETKATAGGQYASYSIYDTAETDAILAFSNSWAYGSAIADLTLMGVPGKIILWCHDLQPNQSATVKLSLVPPRRRCGLRILCNDAQVANLQLAPRKPAGKLLEPQFDVKLHNGLNTFTFIPEFDPSELKDRQQYVKEVRAQGMAASSDARRIADLVENGAPDMDPRQPATALHWNFVRPPVDQPGFAPYLIFQAVKVVYH